jgi:hypothetical protein
MRSLLHSQAQASLHCYSAGQSSCSPSAGSTKAQLWGGTQHNKVAEERLPLHSRQPSPEAVLSGVGDVQKAVLILVLCVHAGHQRGGGRELVVAEDEQRLLG